ncbi:methyl-accepting chemotaxis protein [Maritalea sp.]|uniref:methyl-accepting chemotaxis protein n=1 Tax=Maritalea sp. TaxID=2003361 RepID=UPI003EF72FC2
MQNRLSHDHNEPDAFSQSASKLNAEALDVKTILGDLDDIGKAQAKLLRAAIGATRNMDQSNNKLSSCMAETQQTADQTRTILSNSAEKIATCVEASAVKLGHLSNNAIGFKDTLGSIDETVKKVQVTSVSISQIARETQLLSLNASVEAARAGEKGKGFAIIATAVKRLADEIQGFAAQNSENLETLAEILANVQTRSSESDELAKGVVDDADATKNTSDQLNELVRSVSQLVKDIETMSGPIAENQQAAQSVGRELTALGNSMQSSHEQLQSARLRSGSILGISNEMLNLCR